METCEDDSQPPERERARETEGGEQAQTAAKSGGAPGGAGVLSLLCCVVAWWVCVFTWFAFAARFYAAVHVYGSRGWAFCVEGSRVVLARVREGESGGRGKGGRIRRGI